MAGLIPCAVESDFNRLDKERVTSIFTQVSLAVTDQRILQPIMRAVI
jgi:hypothetical protein